eukprot:c24103_g1_i1.p1 GENE.c24103_g1_i1~~c24103_g1_i1.p1  ORF type:complete len:105 (-),score=10.09 c24103_g1_i1:1-315(-)
MGVDKFSTKEGFVQLIAIILELVGFCLALSEMDDLGVGGDLLKWHNVLAFFVAVGLFCILFFDLHKKYIHLLTVFAVVAAVALSMETGQYDNDSTFDHLFGALV